MPKTEDEIDAEAQQWVSRLADPYATKKELRTLDAWLLVSAHAQAFARHIAPLEVQAAQSFKDLGIKPPTDS